MFEDMIFWMQKRFSVEVPLEREVEQCIFYRVNIAESYGKWRKSMEKLGLSNEAIDKATVIMREKLGETK